MPGSRDSSGEPRSPTLSTSPGSRDAERGPGADLLASSPMRVVFFAKRHKRSGITLHMRRALETAGHEVLAINKHRAERLLGETLGTKLTLARARLFRPDAVLVFTFDCDPGTMEALRAGGARVGTFFDDCPLELDERILRAGR